MPDPDIFVCGGGPAGLATAIAARQKGFAVTVADGSRPPIDKACGEGIMPPGGRALAALGIDASALRAAPFRGVRFIEGAREFSGTFATGCGLGVRRTVLSEALLAAAREEMEQERERGGGR